VEYEHIKKGLMREKTGVITGLYLPEKAQHSRQRTQVLGTVIQATEEIYLETINIRLLCTWPTVYKTNANQHQTKINHMTKISLSQ